MPTGPFRKPVSSSPVRVMGSRRLACGSVLVLPSPFPASPGWSHKPRGPSVASCPLRPQVSGLLAPEQRPEARMRGVPGPSSCNPSFLLGDSWRRRPPARSPMARLLPACAVHPKTCHHVPLSPSTLEGKDSCSRSRAKRFPFAGGSLRKHRPEASWAENAPASCWVSPKDVYVLVSLQFV